MQAITNTSPLLYLYRMSHLYLLEKLFDSVFTTPAVLQELRDGATHGYDVPQADSLGWLKIESPAQAPSEWLAVDLGTGELSCLALAFENPSRIVILDDLQARRIAQMAGFQVWGTLRILLEAKKTGLAPSVAPLMDALTASGMWIAPEIRRRVLMLAGES